MTDKNFVRHAKILQNSKLGFTFLTLHLLLQILIFNFKNFMMTFTLKYFMLGMSIYKTCLIQMAK